MRGSIVSGAVVAFALIFSSVCALGDDPPSNGSAAIPNIPSTLELHLTPTLHLGEPSMRGNGLSDADAFNPLRLSLTSGIFPIGGALDPDCKNHAEMSGSTLNGFAVKRAVFLRLTPQLTLNGFSRMGCVGDSAAGGGFTYTSMIKPNLWLVGSAGAYGTPSVGTIPARVTSDVRVDVVMKNNAGRTFSIGLGAGGRNEGHGGSTVGGFRFGGSF